MAHMCDFPLNDLTHEFDTLTGGHAVTLAPGSVIEVHGTPIGGSSTWGPQYPDGKAAWGCAVIGSEAWAAPLLICPVPVQGPPGRLIKKRCKSLIKEDSLFAHYNKET